MMFTQYVDYIKDNPEGHWFKRKLYGWGWTPATWQGWLTIGVFAALVIANFYRLDAASHSSGDTPDRFVYQTIVLFLLLIAICWKKGQRPRWQWGIPKRDGDAMKNNSY